MDLSSGDGGDDEMERDRNHTWGRGPRASGQRVFLTKKDIPPNLNQATTSFPIFSSMSKLPEEEVTATAGNAKVVAP